MADGLCAAMSEGGARALRGALDASSHSLWTAGDVLVAELGPTPGSTHRDGSLAKMRVVAEAVGVEVHAVANWRVVATAWPQSCRVEGVSWGVHRVLVAVPDRRRVLLAFVDHCRAKGVTAGRPRLEAWLARNHSDRKVLTPLTTVVARTVGRVERLGSVDFATCTALGELADRFADAVSKLRVDDAVAS